MAKFFLGFGVATTLWLVAAAALVLGLGWGPPPEELPEDDSEVVAVVEVEAPVDAPTKRRRRRRGAAGTSSEEPPTRNVTGSATTGDDLREGEMRTVDGEGTGGEAQLSGRQIEAGFDTVLPRVRRCLVLAASDEAVRGRLTFGLRIRGTGEVSAVNLSGPAAVTTGECGDCLRAAARGIRFPSFDGPEMVARYPISLE